MCAVFSIAKSTRETLGHTHLPISFKRRREMEEIKRAIDALTLVVGLGSFGVVLMLFVDL